MVYKRSAVSNRAVTYIRYTDASWCKCLPQILACKAQAPMGAGLIRDNTIPTDYLNGTYIMCFKCLLLPVSTVCFLPRPLQAVDYHGISLSRKFEVYVRATAELKRVDLMNVTRNEKVAFFINVYNALVIHAFVVQGPPNNLWKRFRVSGGTVGVACST